MQAKSILLGFILSLVAAAQNASAPYHIKTDQLGETLMQWTGNNPGAVKCDDIRGEDPPRSVDHAWDVYCVARDSKNAEFFTYGTAPLLTQTAWFHHELLYKVELTFMSSDPLPYVVSALKQKFGKPFSKQSTRVYNGFGSRSVEKRLTWTNKISTLNLDYSNVPGARVRLTFTLQGPRGQAQSRRAQISRAYEDM